MSDVYKAIAGFPRYEIDEEGNVYGQGRWGRRIILKTFKMQGRLPYQYVNLYCDGKMKTLRRAVIMCETFFGPRPSHIHEASHLNGRHEDDRKANLAWKTKIENAADRHAHGTQIRGELVSLAKLNESAVLEIRSAPKGYGWRIPLAEKFGVNPSTITEVRRGSTWKHVQN